MSDLRVQREGQLRIAIGEAIAAISGAKKRINEYHAELEKIGAMPPDFGQQNMIDPADVDIYQGEGGPMIHCVDCSAEHCPCVAR
jgi:hypothetical protein